MRAGKYIASAFVAFLGLPAVTGSASAASDPTGIWMNDTGRGAVEIKHCGDMLCGNVVWVQSATDADGCGKQIIGNVAPVGGGRWDNGWIYSPERGRKYDVELTPLANGDLKVLGYAGMKFLSKTMIWKRAPQDLQLCGQTGNQANGKSETPAIKKPNLVTAAVAEPAAPIAPKAAPPNAPSTAIKEASAEPASPAHATDTHKSDEAKAPGPSSSETTADAATNEPAGTDGKADDIGGALGKMKIGDLQLDKVLTRTKSGKCKLDLPWVKVTIDCEQ